MEIAVERFEKLLRAIASARAGSSGYNAMLQDLERRRNQAVGELARAEELAAGVPIPRRAQPRLPPGATLNEDQWPMRDSVERREEQIETLRRDAERLTAEYRDLDAQQVAVHARWTSLSQFERACRSWAAESGVILPGEPPSAGRATMQPGPPARQFIAPGAAP